MDIRRAANWKDPGTGEACFVALGVSEVCLSCGKHVSQHFGLTEYRCQGRNRTPPPPFPRILERATGEVHAGPASKTDQVTLCGITDWLGTRRARNSGGVPTELLISCRPCMWVIEHCQGHRLKKGDGGTNHAPCGVNGGLIE